MPQQSGTVAGKSFQMFMINDALLAKVVAAVKQADSLARNKGTIQSLELFYEGFRQHIVIGRLLVIPAKVADNRDDFPVALLYGSLVREFAGEDVADLITHKIGDSEFDEYGKADFLTIKDKLFKNNETGRYECLVLFLPAWVNPREYVSFKMTKDDAALGNLLRHLVFAAYYNPAVSSAFETMMTDMNTDKVDVTDITPKLTYPFLTENPLKSFPDLHPGDEHDSKIASKKKPVVCLTKKLAAELFDSPKLDKGETDVLSALTQNISEKITDPEELDKKATTGTGLRNRPDYGAPDSYSVEMNDANSKKASSDYENTLAAFGFIFDKDLNRYWAPKQLRYVTLERDGSWKLWGAPHDDEGPLWMVYAKGTSVGELSIKLAKSYPTVKQAGGSQNSGGSWTSANGTMLNTPAVQDDDAAVARLKSMSTNRFETKLGKVAGLEWSIEEKEDGSGFAWKIFNKGLLGEKIKDFGTSQSPEEANTILKSKLDEMQGFNHEAGTKYCDKCDRLQAACICEKTAAQGKNSISGKAVAARDANEAKLAKIRSTRGSKTADVEMSFEGIWNEITEDMGPAPLVELKEVPTSKSKSKSEPKAESKKESPAEKPVETKIDTDSSEKVDTPEEAADEKPDESPKKKSIFSFIVTAEEGIPEANSPEVDERQPQSDLNTDHAPEAHDVPVQVDEKVAAKDVFTLEEMLPVLGITETDWHALGESQQKKLRESAYKELRRRANPSKMKHKQPKRADFSYAAPGIPGQVIQEFYPELQHEIVDYPNYTNDGMQLSPEIMGDGAAGSWEGFAPGQATGTIPDNNNGYVSTDPGALGVGRDSQSQVLEGPSLRSETGAGIRGYGFQDEFYQNYEALDGGLLVASLNKITAKKKTAAHKDECLEQFDEFLKLVIGEVAASMIAAFRVTNRMIFDKVPGVGEINLLAVERGALGNSSELNAFDHSSRLKYLIDQLNDNEIQEAINGAYAQSSVWCDNPKGGYVFEVFCRAESIDTDNLTLKYKFITGTRTSDISGVEKPHTFS